MGVRAYLIVFVGVLIITDVMTGLSQSFPTSRRGADKLINSCMSHLNFMAAAFPPVFYSKPLLSSAKESKCFNHISSKKIANY